MIFSLLVMDSNSVMNLPLSDMVPITASSALILGKMFLIFSTVCIAVNEPIIVFSLLASKNDLIVSSIHLILLKSMKHCVVKSSIT